MSWYFCYGCGPSLRCDICGACECDQTLHANARDGTCPGCVKASAMKGGPIPWNMQVIPEGTRGWKHLRARRTAMARRRHMMRANRADLRRWIRSRGRWIKNPHSWASILS